MDTRCGISYHSHMYHVPATGTRVSKVRNDATHYLPKQDWIHCRGYLGPGGLADGGSYENCTGGADGYVDQTVLSVYHMYAYPTCRVRQIPKLAFCNLNLLFSGYLPNESAV